MSARSTSRPAPTVRRLRAVLLLLAAGVIGLYLLLPLLSSSEAMRRRVERAVVAASGKDVRIERLHLGYDLGVHLSSLSVRDRDAEPFLTVERAVVHLSPRGWFAGQPYALQLVAPRIFVDRLPGSAQNGGAASLPLRRVDIVDGYFVVGSAGDAIGPVTLSLDTIHHEQEAHASLQIDPQLPPVDIVATLGTSAGKLSLAALRVGWSGVALEGLAQRFPVIASANTLEGTLELSATASGALDDLSGSGSLQVQGWRYRSDAIEIAGELDVPFTWQGNRITLQQPGARFDAVQWTAGGLSGSVPVVTLSGTITREGSSVFGTGKLTANKLQAHNPTSERVLEDLALEVTVDARWRAAEPLALRLGLAATGGELLWDGIYADVSRHPTQLAGDVTSTARGIDVSKLEARAKGIGTLKGSLQLGPAAAVQKAALQIDAGDLDALYVLALRDPYKESYPLLAQTSVHGSLDARVDYARVASGFRLTGNLRLRDASLAASAPLLAVQGLNLDLPLQLGALSGRAPQAGKLRVRGMRFGEVEVDEVLAALSVRANTIELAAPAVLRLLGGTLHVGELVFAEISSAQPRASLGVTVQDLDLESLTKALGLVALPGTMSGSIPRITATAGTVRSEGEIGIEAFDGKLAVRNLSIDQLFSPVPAFGLDLDFHDLSLARLTETLEVGRVSGVVRGEVRHLAIVNGQPLSFDAWMETVERSGVAQRISVSAIRQLSILGGSGGDPFSKGILGFFDEYRYAKMGFKCHLENDRFRLRGVETIDGKEYLVVGSRLPPSVNVVSHTQVISFSEMVSRLQRVTAAEDGTKDKGEQP